MTQFVRNSITTESVIREDRAIDVIITRLLDKMPARPEAVIMVDYDRQRAHVRITGFWDFTEDKSLISIVHGAVRTTVEGWKL